MATGFRSKKQIAYDLLRNDILNGTMAPGSRLVIDELAVKFNISQIPIREAIGLLEADGFVTTQPNVGARVTEIDANFIYEVFALLESMEVICTRAACQTMTDEQIKHLEELVLEMDTTVQDVTQWSEQNKAMHLFICECAHTDLVEKMMTKVLDHWDRLRLHYLQDVFAHRIVEAQADHIEILRAIKKRDPEEVEDVIRKHNQKGLQSYIRHLKSEGHLKKVLDQK